MVTFDKRCDVVELEAKSEQSQEMIEPADLDASHDSHEHDLEDDPNALIKSILQDTLMNVNADHSLVSLDSSVLSLSTPPISPQQYVSPNQKRGVPYGSIPSRGEAEGGMGSAWPNRSGRSRAGR
jgi:hypothetical protein